MHDGSPKRLQWALLSALLIAVPMYAITLKSSLLHAAVGLGLALAVINITSVPGAPARITVQRLISQRRLYAFEPLAITLRFTNNGSRTVRFSYSDQLLSGDPVDANSARGLCVLQAGESRDEVYTIKPRRGLLQFSEVTINEWSVLFLATQRWQFALPDQVWVSPVRRTIGKTELAPKRRRGNQGPLLTRRSGNSDEFFGLRHYRQGDAMRRVHWRASARTDDELLVKEYETSQIGEVYLIVDARQHCAKMIHQESLLDYICSIADGFASQVIKQGHGLGMALLGHDHRPRSPRSGTTQLRYLQEQLIKVVPKESKDAEVLYDHIRSPFKPGSSLIWLGQLTVYAEAGLVQLHRKGYNLKVISLADDDLTAPGESDHAGYRKHSQLQQKMRVMTLQAHGIDAQEYHPYAHFRARQGAAK